jgi:translation initiation factor 4B
LIYRPVDTLSKEAAISERLEKEREQVKDRIVHTMSRTSSRTASHRGETRSTPSTAPTSPKAETTRSPAISNANIRPSFSFANAAASARQNSGDQIKPNDTTVNELAEQVDQVVI